MKETVTWKKYLLLGWDLLWISVKTQRYRNGFPWWLRGEESANAGDVGSVLDPEDPMCHRAAQSIHYNYSACALEPGRYNYCIHVLQLPKPASLELHKRGHHNEKSTMQLESSPCSLQLETSPWRNEDPVKNKNK